MTTYHALCIHTPARCKLYAWLIVSCNLFLASPVQGERPGTVPMIRQGAWVEESGGTTITCGSNILYQNDDGALRQTALTLAHEINILLQCRHDLQVRLEPRRSIAAGDIHLEFGAISGEFEEYGLDSRGGFWIDGVTETGAFWGTRTLLQLITKYGDWSSSPARSVLPGGGHGRPFGGGAGTDRPLFPERGLTLDVGRKFLPVPDLKKFIREMAYVKMNILHLHLADGQSGIRLVPQEGATSWSSTISQYVAADGAYTKSDIDDIVNFAAIYHVMVVPEIDMPGHCGYITSRNPSYGLGWVDNAFVQACDITNPAVRTLLKAMVAEFMGWFPSYLWFAGGDEWLPDRDPRTVTPTNGFAVDLNVVGRNSYPGQGGDASDIVPAFLNEINSAVRRENKWLRVWGDALGFKSARYGASLPFGTGAVALSPEVVLHLWNGSVDPNEAIRVGYHVVNQSVRTLYYTDSWVTRINSWTYTNNPGEQSTPWDHFSYDTDNSDTPIGMDAGKPAVNYSVAPEYRNTDNVKGAWFAIWRNEQKLDNNGIFESPRFHLYIAAQEMWGSEHHRDVPSISEFERLIFAPLRHAPENW